MKKEINNKSDFVSGILYACQYLIIYADRPEFAKDIMIESGYNEEDFLKEQKKTGFYTRKINQIIKEAFE